MSASSIPFTAGDTFWDADPQFNAMALYAEYETGHRAEEIRGLQEAARRAQLDFISNVERIRFSPVDDVVDG